MFAHTGCRLIRSCSRSYTRLQYSIPIVTAKKIELPRCIVASPKNQLPNTPRCQCGQITTRSYSERAQGEELGLNEYERISEETLHQLTEYFEELFEDIENDELDINLSSGVLTIWLGPSHGTYVINKQTPNRQIWLSSPSSGPKRYDFVNGQWIYSHDGSNMFRLLEKEFSQVLDIEVSLKELGNYNT